MLLGSARTQTSTRVLWRQEDGGVSALFEELPIWGTSWSLSF